MAIEMETGLDDHDRRLDRVLRKALPDHSLSLIHRLLRQGKVTVNDIPANPKQRLSQGDLIRVESRLREKEVSEKPSGTAAVYHPTPPLPEILWQGSGIIVFNKPRGLAVHGPDSLEMAVNNFLTGKLEHSLSFTPGPLHRLDKPTSGAIAFSSTLQGARLFSDLLRERKIGKIYLAIVEGTVTKSEIWRDTLNRDKITQKTFTTNKNGTAAITAINPVAMAGGFTLAEIRIETGVTHQIRAQAAAHGHPLAGDVKYGGRPFTSREPGAFFLHAWKMEFTENTDGLPRQITASLPEAFTAKIRSLFNMKSI